MQDEGHDSTDPGAPRGTRSSVSAAAPARAGTEPLPADLDFGARYENRGVLGQGGMGAVYEVCDRETEVVYAAKVLRASGARAAARYAAFKDEFVGSLNLRHRHICRVFHFERTPEGRPLILMERLRGRDLARVLREDGPVPPERLLGWLEGVAAALDEAHLASIVHRDVKPSNLFLGDDGVVRLLDFGVASWKEADPDETGSGFAGTLGYAAPEQLAGVPPARTMDVFSLAATIAELCTALPWAVALARDGLPAAVRRVLATALDPDPAARPVGASALVVALRAALAAPAAAAGGPEGAASAPQPEPAPAGGARTAAAAGPAARAPRRRRALAVAALAGALVASATAVWLVPPTAEGPAAAGVAAWTPWDGPAPPRVAVLPFASTGAPSAADAVLWPLVDRLIGGALDADERVFQRLRRIDPVLVEETIERAGRSPVPPPGRALELAQRLDADLVVSGTIESVPDGTRLVATLTRARDAASTRIEARGARLEDAVADLAQAVRRALGHETASGAAASAVDPGRASRLLFPRAAALARLVEAPGGTGVAGQRDAALAALAEDPEALGAAWLVFLTRPAERRSAGLLAQAAEGTDDAELRRFFAAIGDGRTRPDACVGIDTGALGRRYPETLGPLAAAACLLRQGRVVEALERAQEAHRDLLLRPLAHPFLSYLLHFTNPTCAEELERRRAWQRLMPGYPPGWSVLGLTLARCGEDAAAREAFAVAHALSGAKPEEDRVVAQHATQGFLILLDLAEARRWADRMEGGHPDANESMLRSLLFYLQGQFGAGLEVTRRALDAAREGAGDTWTMLATSYVYVALAVAQPEAAEAVLAEYDALFRDPADAGNRYGLEMLRLALARARGELDGATAAARAEQLGRTVEERLGALGRNERSAHEACFFSHFGDEAACSALLLASGARSKQLGGCRVRHGERLLRDGQTAAALAELRAARRDIVWSRFLFAELLADALLGEARALERLDRDVEARAAWERIRRNYERADRPLAAVRAAWEAAETP